MQSTEWPQMQAAPKNRPLAFPSHSSFQAAQEPLVSVGNQRAGGKHTGSGCHRHAGITPSAAGGIPASCCGRCSGGGKHRQGTGHRRHHSAISWREHEFLHSTAHSLTHAARALARARTLARARARVDPHTKHTCLWTCTHMLVHIHAET